MKRLFNIFPFTKKIPLKELLIGYAYTLGLFVIIDALWLGIIAQRFYELHVGYIMASHPNWIAILLFYLLYPVGIMYFALQPSHGNIQQAALRGALFGFFTYATYELTNWAVIFKWPGSIVIVDILWGTCLCAAVSTATVYAYKKTVSS